MAEHAGTVSGHDRTGNGQHPNVVLIVVDDLGWRDLGCTGSDFYQTPRIDRFAAATTVCRRAYAPAPNCSPSRASLLTGRAPARIGVTQIVGNHHVGRRADVWSRGFLPRQEYTLARALRAAGYHSWHLGKWHLGPRHSWPDRHGFDVNIGGCDWGHPRSYWSPYGCPTLDDGPDGEYLTDRLTDEAVTLIRDHARSDSDRPFFLNLWHYAVHTPLQAPAELTAKYQAEADALGRAGTDDVVVGEEMPYWHRGEQRVQRRTRQGHPAYAAMVENLDTNIGRVLDTIDDLGLTDDTVVIVTSDNGGLHCGPDPATNNSPLAEGKGWLCEGGLRVPLIIGAPGGAPGHVVETPVTLTDLYPTILSLCGVTVDRAVSEAITIDGADLSDTIRGSGEPAPERPLCWHFPHYPNGGATPASAVRRGRWKLIRSYEDDQDRLFDLVTDPEEAVDLAGREPQTLQQMITLLEDWLSEVGALIPPMNPQQPFDEWAAAEPNPDEPDPKGQR